MNTPDERAGSLARVHHDTVDGVPVVWADLPVETSVSIVFAVGHEDLSPATSGIHHLIEHLVMRRVGTVLVEHNAESALSRTEFWARGPEDQLVEFVAKVCAAVTSFAEVTDDEIELERSTILAEIERSGTYTVRTPESARFGLAGVGLAAASHSRLLDWTPEELRAAAAQWFHRDTAVVTWSGRPPEALRLPLPTGPAPARSPHPHSLVPGRVATPVDGELICLQALLEGGPSLAACFLAAQVVEHELLARLRTERGDVYAVQRTLAQLDDATLWTFDLNPHGDRRDATILASLDVFDTLSSTGPDTVALARARDTLSYEWSLRSSQATWLDHAAALGLRGRSLPNAATLIEDLLATTAENVRAVVAAWTDQLWVCHPVDHTLSDDVVDRLRGRSTTILNSLGNVVDEGKKAPTVRRRELLSRSTQWFNGRWRSPARTGSFVILADRFALVDVDFEVSVPFEDIVLVGSEGDGDIEIVTSRGGVVLVNPSFFRRLARPLDTALDALPNAVRYRKDRTHPIA